MDIFPSARVQGEGAYVKDWLRKYPRAAALLQGDEEELLYDADADADADEVTQHQDPYVCARIHLLVFHARTPWQPQERE
jgi:hypothetical protein